MVWVSVVRPPGGFNNAAGQQDRQAEGAGDMDQTLGMKHGGLRGLDIAEMVREKRNATSAMQYEV